MLQLKMTFSIEADVAEKRLILFCNDVILPLTMRTSQSRSCLSHLQALFLTKKNRSA